MLGKKKSQNKDLSSLNIHIKNQQMSHDNIEKLPTIQKIFIVQALLKEMISIKDRFEDNKEKMKEKIEDNCYKYFKNTILIKEIFDYCQSKKPEFSLNYILIKNTEQTLYLFEEANKNFIEKFFLDLRNDNDFMLKIINSIDENYYDQLSYFIVHFLYENTINSSFTQDELMIMTYLVFESKIIFQKEVNLIDGLEFDKNNFIYHYLKAFTHKTEIRNYLCSILHDIILDIEKEKNILYCNFNTIYESMFKDVKDKNKKSDNFLKKNSSIIEKESGKKKKVDLVHRSTLFEPKKANELIYNDDEISRFSVGLNNTKSSYRNDYLDEFFKNNDVTQFMFSQKLSQLNSCKNKTDIELAYMSYISSLRNQCHTKNKEKFSNNFLLKTLKQTNINVDKITLEELCKIYKAHYVTIIKYADKIMEAINKNINLLPYSIKYMFYILNVLMKIYNKKSVDNNQYHHIFLIKLRIFFGGFILFNINNPICNGIVSDCIISHNTFENLNIIHTIFAKIFSGNLFADTDKNKDYSIFNKYIIDRIPFLFGIIKNIDKYIENNFEPPLFIQNLSNFKNRNNNYDYFAFNKDENIR